MYASIVEAAVRDQQSARRAHAADVRRANAATVTAATVTADTVAPAPLPARRRLSAWHPMLSFHRWLAAGQM